MTASCATASDSRDANPQHAILDIIPGEDVRFRPRQRGLIPRPGAVRPPRDGDDSSTRRTVRPIDPCAVRLLVQQGEIISFAPPNALELSDPTLGAITSYAVSVTARWVICHPLDGGFLISLVAGF